jgi:hypothetical protein
MRSLLRFGALGCALALTALPLAIGGGSVAGAVYSSPATVSASNWSTMANTVTTPGTGTQAGAVSCVTSVFCVAVTGGSPTSILPPLGPPSGLLAYAELWNGTTWSPMTLPTVIGATADTLVSVSCVTTSFCLAVGYATVSGASSILMEQWNGSAWALVTAPAVPGANGPSLYGVSCTSATFCQAVGGAGGGSGAPIALQWNGSTWSVQTIGLPSNANNGALLSASCTTTSFCMAVGAGSNGAYLVSMAYTWNGATWTQTTLPPTGTIFVTAYVSCVGLSFCAATAGNPGPVNQILTWNGSSWSMAQNVPTPTGGGTLDGISCFSATSCAAVGTNGAATQVLTFNGQSWTQVSNPPIGAPGTANTGLFGVDCLTDWSCVAAGVSAFSGNTYQPLLAMAPIARSGYYFVGSDGGIYNYGTGGSAPFLGSMGGTKLNSPVVGMATMPAGDGYYLVAADGGVFNFGSAQFYGSMGGKALNKPVVGIAVTPDGGGYWLVASDGGIFSFGDAQFYGSMGGKPLNKPIVGIAPTPNGNGYYEVASDGGIFTFPTVGGPPFLGSAGSLTLNKPVVGMAVASNGGYYMVASDGGIFSYPSTEPFYGSTGSIRLNKPIVGMDLVSNGYYLGAADGGVFAFPTTNGPPFLGSRGGQPINAPVVAISG